MDYKVGDLVISAKSGSPTNTVKPQDILMLLAKRPDQLRLYQSTREYRVLKILAERTVMEGPLAAMEFFLGRDYYSWWKQLEASPQYRARGGVIPIRERIILAERYLQTQSRTGSLNYTRMFADAIRNNVVYVKFKLDTTGLGQFEAVVADDVLAVEQGKRPYLRSKNSPGRIGDRMGIQI